MFTLKYEFRGYESNSLIQPPKTVEMTLDSDEANLDELCQFFGDFLRGCGYVYDGNVQITEEDYSTPSEDYNYASIGDDEFANAILDDELANNENVDTTGYEPIAETPKEVQTEFNFSKDTQ